jgi:prevent-host-death family protein
MIPKLVPITDMKRQAGKILDALRADRSPVIITDHGRAAAVLLDVASYEVLTRRHEILEGLAAGEKDLAEGRTLDWEAAKTELRKWRR